MLLQSFTIMFNLFHTLLVDGAPNDGLSKGTIACRYDARAKARFNAKESFRSRDPMPNLSTSCLLCV